MAVQRPSRRLRRIIHFFTPIYGTEHVSPPSLTTCDRELVSVLVLSKNRAQGFEPETSNSAVSHFLQLRHSLYIDIIMDI